MLIDGERLPRSRPATAARFGISRSFAASSTREWGRVSAFGELCRVGCPTFANADANREIARCDVETLQNQVRRDRRGRLSVV
jgi:hypothetical protein